MKKKGISAVVATVLIILIVIVGIGIVWRVILPLFAELEYLSYSDVQLNIVFQGNTVYDSNRNFAFVQVERGKDEVNITGVEIGFSFGGLTKTYQSPKVPTPNGKYTYKFNFTNDSDMGIPEGVVPDKVTVAPIFTINNKVRLGKILDNKPMPSGRIHLSVEEWEKANNDSAIPVVVVHDKGGDEPGTPVPVIITYYYDGDGDGYGAVSQSFEEGKNDSGYILVGGDCDDIDPARNPGVEEIYQNSIDENCDSFFGLDDCMNLNFEGGNYLLENDVSHSSLCMNISADNILLDLGGNTISGDRQTESYGVYAGEVSNITLVNGYVGNFDTGIYLTSVENSVFSNLESKNNIGYGMFVHKTSYSSFSDITSSDNEDDGIFIWVLSKQNHFSDITADNNLEYGIRLNWFSQNNVFFDVYTSDNGGGGWASDGLAEYNNVTRLTSRDNYYGAVIYQVNGIIISDSTMCGNDYDLVYSTAYTSSGTNNVFTTSFGNMTTFGKVADCP